MTKKIFRAVFFTALSVFLASLVLFMWVLYDYFSAVQKNQLKMQTSLAAQGVSKEGADYFDGFDPEGFRITWISENGTVLFDSQTDSSEMENHLEREEIRAALESGFGESSRYSVTLTERLFYCAQRLPDSTVIRLSVSQSSLLTLIMAMLQPILFIFAAAFVLSLVLASRLSKKIVKPLNELNLDEPLNNDGYDEIAPLLKRLNSQQKKIREQGDELEQKRNEFEAVTNGMTEGIVLLNDKHDILSLNPAAQKILGANDIQSGQPILSLNRCTELLEILSQSDGGRRSARVIRLDGKIYEVSADPIISDGKIKGTALLFLDVTEKEQAEQRRREFTANVSHELKTPLQTISGYAELMSGGMVNQEDLTDFSEKIYSESLRMIQLVEDIIKLSRLDEGVGDMENEDVDLYALAVETASEMLPQAEKSGVSISVKGEQAFIHGIPRLIKEIVFNLCDNAVKYNVEGGSVTVAVTNRDGKVRLEVSDTGIGIPKEDMERVFERFYRADKSRQWGKRKGTGLGLSIVKHAAAVHNADVELQSAVGGGTTVGVVFDKRCVD
ncbi:MAG: ATP-binding protein [Firmicutes bacterium]|nr:ATP-binding protein [[Eubacterium] siraeum]MCM1487997.1 ATP-binding protein [Bacillota bacterium]